MFYKLFTVTSVPAVSSEQGTFIPPEGLHSGLFIDGWATRVVNEITLHVKSQCH